MIWPRILVFTSMMLRVLTPAAFGSYGAGIYIPKLGLVPKHVRPVRPVANLNLLICWRVKLSYQFGSGTAKGAYGNSPKGGVFPGTSVQPLNPIGGSL